MESIKPRTIKKPRIHVTCQLPEDRRPYLISILGFEWSWTQFTFADHLDLYEPQKETDTRYCINTNLMAKRVLSSFSGISWEGSKISWEKIMHDYLDSMLEQQAHVKDGRVKFYLVSPVMEEYAEIFTQAIPREKLVFASNLAIASCRRRGVKKLLLMDTNEILAVIGKESVFAKHLAEGQIELVQMSQSYYREIGEILTEAPYNGSDFRTGEEPLHVETFSSAIISAVREYDIDAVLTSEVVFPEIFDKYLPGNFPRNRQGQPIEFITLMDAVAEDMVRLQLGQSRRVLSDWYLGLDP